METYRNQILLQGYLEKSRTPEAKEHLLSVEKSYQTARRELEDEINVQDKNFYQGLKDGLHTEHQEKQYLDYKEDRRLRLKDEYLFQGEETYERCHPVQAQQEREHNLSEQKRDRQSARNLNNGYLLEKYEPELSAQLQENIRNVSQPDGQTQAFLEGRRLGIEEKQNNMFVGDAMTITAGKDACPDIQPDDEQRIPGGEKSGIDLSPDIND